MDAEGRNALILGSNHLLWLAVRDGTDRLRWLGAVTPIGGLGLIFGWFALALAFVRTGRSDRHSA